MVLGVLVLCINFLSCTAKEETMVLDSAKLSEPKLNNETLKKSEKISADVQQEERGCSDDNDCVLVPDGCCSCNSGGEQTAINQNSLGPLQNRRRVVCADVGCLTVINDSPNCRAKQALCVNGTCEVNRPKELKKIKIEPINAE